MRKVFSLISAFCMARKLRNLKLLMVSSIAWLAGALFLWWQLPVQPRVTLSSAENLWIEGFSPDGRILATSNCTTNIRISNSTTDFAGGHIIDENGPIRLWDVDTGQEIVSFSMRGKSVVAFGFGSHGKRLAVDSLGDFEREENP